MTNNERMNSVSSAGDMVSDLFHRMADGDESALAALYDQWGDRVHTVAFWILQDSDEAEDVVEETFCQVWRSAGRYDGRRSAGCTWLMMIARSRAIDRLRFLRRRADWIAAPATAMALLDEIMSFKPALPDGTETERHSGLAAALDELPTEQRQMVELAFLEGLSHAQIAVQTSQPLGTVKTRIRLGMQKLREALTTLREDLR